MLSLNGEAALDAARLWMLGIFLWSLSSVAIGQFYCPAPIGAAWETGQTREVRCWEENSRPQQVSQVLGAASVLFGQKLDVNQVSERSLESLPGIGPHLASEIVKARKEMPFGRLDEVKRAKGIGPQRLEKMRPWITVDSRSVQTELSPVVIERKASFAGAGVH